MTKHRPITVETRCGGAKNIPVVKSEKTWYFTTISTTIDGRNMPEPARICHTVIFGKPEYFFVTVVNVSKKELKLDDKNLISMPRQYVNIKRKSVAAQRLFGLHHHDLRQFLRQLQKNLLLI